MKLGELFRRHPVADDNFGMLESSLSEMLLLEMAPPLSPEGETLSDEPAVAPTEDAVYREPDAEAAEAADAPLKTTGYTQARLAEFAAFESMHRAAEADLELVGATVSRINAAHHRTREFLNGIHSVIHRTNELEIAAAKLTVDNRALYRQAEQVKRLRSQHEALVEAFRRREGKLLETAESLRNALSEARLDLVDADGRVTTLEAERQETVTALAAMTTQAEMAVRENEMLRERQIHLASDLELASRKRTEAERKADELSAMHARDMSDVAETRSKLAGAEADRLRLQKQHDALLAQMTEANEALVDLQTEMEEQTRRHDVGLQGLKKDKETLMARLEVSARAELEAAERAAALNLRLNEALTDRRVAQDQLAAMQEAGDEADQEAAETDHGIEAPRREGARLKAIARKSVAAERPHRPAKERDFAPAPVNGQANGESAAAS